MTIGKNIPQLPPIDPPSGTVCQYDQCEDPAVRRFGGEDLCTHHFQFMSYGYPGSHDTPRTP